jgi:uncharacterized protein YkwD
VITAGRRAARRVNRVRRHNRLPKLRYSRKLAKAARRWSRHLVRDGRLPLDTSDHSTLSRWPAASSYSLRGEVLAHGYEDPVPAWMRSPGHRAVLLDPDARLIGLGRHRDRRGRPLWTGRTAAR